MIFSLLMVAVAVLLAIPVFTGKGKLLNTENIKKDKVAKYTKRLRVLYALLMVLVLVLAFVNFVEKVAYTAENYYEFTEEYEGSDGVVYAAGVKHETEEMIRILKDDDKKSSGSLCSPASAEVPPYKLSETTYTLSERYSFLGFISHSTARILNYVCLGVSLIVVFLLFFSINSMTDKEAQKKNNQQKNSPVRPSMPRGAFDFSDYKDEVEVGPDFLEDEPQDPPSQKK